MNEHTMNGRPIWCPPARQKDYGFDPIETKSDSVSVSLAEAALLVRHAIKRGLIKLPDKAEAKAAKLGVRSVWAICTHCQVEFSRDKLSQEPRCNVCRLPRKVCTVCAIEFQPQQRKQKCCSKECRNRNCREIAQNRITPKIDCICNGCGRVFQKTKSEHRMMNCSRECGIISMKRKHENKNKTQQLT